MIKPSLNFFSTGRTSTGELKNLFLGCVGSSGIITNQLVPKGSMGRLGAVFVSQWGFAREHTLCVCVPTERDMKRATW